MFKRISVETGPRPYFSRLVLSREWDEDEHPRGQPENAGEFAPKKGGNGGSMVTMTSDPPEHIKKIRIPPAWTDVKYNPDPEGMLMVSGLDSKGRHQSIYSAKYTESQAALKFSRIKEMSKQFGKIEEQNRANLHSQDPKTRALAECAHLIMQTGIRPGGEGDTGAEKQAYGATTLHASHIILNGDHVRLKFIGKKGVEISLPVEDETCKKFLRRRKAEGEGKRNYEIFPISDSHLREYVSHLGEGGFHTKDLRTLLATDTAFAEVKKMKPPKTMTEYKKKVREVAKIVAKKLGNTPIIALKSYIAPECFSQWRVA